MEVDSLVLDRQPLLPGRTWIGRLSLVVNGWTLTIWLSLSTAPLPRSSITWTVVGIRKGLLVYLSIYIYIYIFFFAVMAFGVLLCIDCLMAAVTHFAATCLIFIGWGVSFPVKTLSVFPHFPRQNLLIFGLSFSHFPIFCVIGFSDSLSCVFCS